MSQVGPLGLFAINLIRTTPTGRISQKVRQGPHRPPSRLAGQTSRD